MFLYTLLTVLMQWVIFNGNMERIWMCTCIFRRTGCIYYFGQSWDHNSRVLCAYLCIFVYFLIKLSNTNIKHICFFLRINQKKEKTIIEQMWCYFIQIYSAMSRSFFFNLVTCFFQLQTVCFGRTSCGTLLAVNITTFT